MHPGGLVKWRCGVFHRDTMRDRPKPLADRMTNVAPRRTLLVGFDHATLIRRPTRPKQRRRAAAAEDVVVRRDREDLGLTPSAITNAFTKRGERCAHPASVHHHERRSPPCTSSRPPDI